MILLSPKRPVYHENSSLKTQQKETDKD